MKEAEQRPNQERLTNQANHPRLELGRHFMSDETGRDDITPPPPPEEGRRRRPPEPPPPPPPPEEGRRRRTPTEDEDSEIPEEALRRVREARDADSEKAAIKNLLRLVTPHQQIPRQILELATKYDDTLDYFVNRIIAQPFDAETSDYRLSFYGGINLEQIRDILRTRSEREVVYKRRYHRILGVIEAASLSHEMNKLIVMGQLDRFVQTAAAITPEHLESLQQVPGVAQVMRLFDEEYNRNRAKDDYIKNRGNYDKMLGIERNSETGEIELVTGGSIEAQFRDLVSAERAGIDLGGKLGGLESWQINWAFQAGKILTNLSFRAAELISLGKLKSGDESYGSFPMESAAKLMNWMALSGLRFNISEVRGGVELAQMTRENYQRDRRKQGYGDLTITAIEGKDIKHFEDSGLFQVSGIWSSWRQNLILLKNAPIRVIRGVHELVDGKDKLRDLIDIDEIERELKKRLEKKFIEEEHMSEKKAKERAAIQVRAEQPALLERVYLDESGNLRSEINSYLGVLLKHGSVTPKETDTPEIIEMKYKIRQAIWRRAAEDNPLAIAPFLIGIKFNGEAPRGFVDLTKVLKEEEGAGRVWVSLRSKLRIAHEARLAAINRRAERTGLDIFIEENGRRIDSLALTPAERELLAQIRNNGRLLARDFANIRLPFNMFMNDVLLERAEYGEAGAEFFRRRTAGDLPSLFKSGEEFTKLMDNPGSHPVEEITKVLHGMVQAIGIPLSITTGQDRVAPFAEAILNFISAGSQIKEAHKLKLGPLEIGLPKGFWQWLDKDGIVSFVKNKSNQPNSLAQEKSGEKALALDEFGLRGTLDTWLHEGILRRKLIKDGVVSATDLYDDFLKKFKVKFGGLLLAFLRSLMPVFLLGVVAETGKRTYSGK